jgi:DNA-binding transcriptional regulator YdaS (Cro superfamily)
MKVKMVDAQMIDLLGGALKVSKQMDVSVQAVHKWKREGIPAGKLVMMAAQIEKESHGLVTRKDLFPQSYQVIWPELQ